MTHDHGGSVLVTLGAALVVGGAWWTYPPLAVILTGLALICAGILLAVGRRAPDREEVS